MLYVLLATLYIFSHSESRVEAGEKIVQICKAMGLAKAIVQTIRDRKEEIKAHSFSATPLSISKSTHQNSSIMEEIQKLLDMWIEDNNQRGMPMTPNDYPRKG
ncbi:hypothetical protein QE152_g13738 [Popillia japonica]|uniref:Uncharacterized protein n=1 Tax=Popillia japonica TaxID=7064 RepID=A0AAW1LCL2_POPJA